MQFPGVYNPFQSFEQHEKKIQAQQEVKRSNVLDWGFVGGGLLLMALGAWAIIKG